MSSKKPPKAVAEGSDLTLIAVMQRLSTEEAARAYFERIRWPNGPECPHCGNADQACIWKRTANKETQVRPGLYKCGICSRDFTVTMGTVMEDSHIPLNKWLIAFYMMAASKTQISALQIQRQLELGSYRTAWFMCHRIRFALAKLRPEGKLNGEVEADETYIGGKARGKGRGYTGNKTAVVSLIERGGKVRSYVMGSDRVSGERIQAILKENVAESAKLHTDESPLYVEPGKGFASHDKIFWCHMQTNANTPTQERYTVEIDGIPITTYSPEQALALARLAAQKAAAKAPEPSERSDAPPAPPVHHALPTPAKVARRRKAQPSLYTQGKIVGYLLLDRGTELSKQAIIKGTGLGASAVTRGITSLAEVARARGMAESDVIQPRKAGRERFFKPGPKLGGLLAEVAPRKAGEAPAGFLNGHRRDTGCDSKVSE